jgi:transketolase
MVKALIDGLLELCKSHPKIVILIVDDLETYDALHEQFPERTINIGISECNAVSMAAGLASCGDIPYVIGGDTFMAYRAYEFIRDQLCMQNRNVKVIGIGAGVAICLYGNTHQATEDVGALRGLPGLTVMTPATPTEVKKTVLHSITVDGPEFIRVGRASGYDFYHDGIEFCPYQVQEIRRGKDITIFATGSIACDALQAAEELKERGRADIGVVNVHTIKPFDKEGVVRLSRSYRKWLSVEEHNITGGLGSALSEVIVEKRLHVTLDKLGLAETFAKGHGSYDDMKRVNGLAIENIVQACMKM